MRSDTYAGVAFVFLCVFILWLERRESRIIDARRALEFGQLGTPCWKFMHRTQERPLWRMSWVCASLVTVVATVPYGACIGPSMLNLTVFLVLVFSVSFLSAQAALHHYTRRVMCPQRACGVSERHGNEAKCIAWEEPFDKAGASP